MSIKDLRNEDAIDFLANVIVPASDIIADEEVKKLYREKGTTVVKLASFVLSKHKKSVLEMIAASEQKTVDEMDISVKDILVKTINALNELKENPTLAAFFTLQRQKMDVMSSGSVMPNTTAIEKE